MSTTDYGMRPLTDEERHNLATHLSNQLAKEARKNNMVEIAKRPPEDMSLFGIEQHQIDLLLFRQDCLERLAILEADPAKEEAAEEIGEIRAELEAADLAIKNVAGQEVAKVDRCANLLRMCDRMQAFCKDERDRLNRKAKRWEAVKESVENVVMEALALADRTSFDSPTNRLRVQRNSSPRVEITDPQAVQDRFIKVTLEVTQDRWKQMRQALPELSEFCTVKDSTFITGTIAKVLRKAAQEEVAARETMEGSMLEKTLKQIERVKGAQLQYGKHLRCE